MSLCIADKIKKKHPQTVFMTFIHSFIHSFISFYSQSLVNSLTLEVINIGKIKKRKKQHNVRC